jgi:hypothetical protein
MVTAKIAVGVHFLTLTFAAVFLIFQQRVDVTCWISFCSDRCVFPIEVSGESSKVDLCDDHKLHILIEADYLKATNIRDANYCEVSPSQICGILKASKTCFSF